MIHILSWLLAILLLSSFSFGCVKRPPTPPWLEKVATLTEPIGSDEIFKLPEGEKVSFQYLSGELQTAPVIFVGEVHDQAEHHRIQLRILQDLMSKTKEVVLAMEMFQKSQQSILDRWSQGSLTEEEFLKEIQWDSTWGMDYRLYKGILDEIRNHRLRLLGLNVERDLVRKVAQNGIRGLSPEDKMKLPEMDLTNQEHRRYIASIYKTHREGLARDVENFYQAQCLWDEGMAEALSDFLKSPEADGKTILIFAGNGHILFNFGIPMRFYRRTPIPYRTVVLMAWKKEIDEDLALPDASTPPGDFLWITKDVPSEKRRPRIGVVLKEKEDPKGIWIERVIPNSPAEKAGLLPGDQFLNVEGKEIGGVKDIHDALELKGWGKDITFTILREDLRKEIRVKLPPLKE